MITSEIIYHSDLRTEATHRLSGNSIVTDAPPDNKGKGEAFSPTDLMATSLASCMMTIMGISAREHGFNIDGTRAEVTKIMASSPRRISEVRIDLFFPPNAYTSKQKKLIDIASRTCPVAKSLHPDLKQEVNLHF